MADSIFPTAGASATTSTTLRWRGMTFGSRRTRSSRSTGRRWTCSTSASSTALGGHAGLRVVDAYAGIGVLASYLAAEAREVVCIESNPRRRAARRAQRARQTTSPSVLHFVLSPVEDAPAARRRRGDGRRRDPGFRRGGCSGRVTGWLALAGRSGSSTCHAIRRRSPATCTPWSASGPIACDSLDVVDMFPQTYHVESVVRGSLARQRLRRRGAGALRYPLKGYPHTCGGGCCGV